MVVQLGGLGSSALYASAKKRKIPAWEATEQEKNENERATNKQGSNQNNALSVSMQKTAHSYN